MTNITQEQFTAAMLATARNIAAVLIAFGVIWGATWFAIQPRVDAYFEDKIKSTSEAVESTKREIMTLTNAVNSLNERIGREDGEILEFMGSGVIAGVGPFNPGGIVPIRYFIKRNNTCATNYRVQFYSSATNRIEGQFSYTVEGTQAAPSLGFSPFTIGVRLPADMRDGWYSYEPVASSPECPEKPAPQVPPSEFFEVRSQ